MTEKRREIRFRGWDKEYENMYLNAYPFEHLVYVEMHDDDYTFQQFKHKMEVVNGKYFYFIVAKDIELMQYTGLLDCNGKEIWEGDIVRWKIWSPSAKDEYDITEKYILASVEYVRGCFYARERMQIIGTIEPHRKIEVIGNVYENPELISKLGGPEV
jgi:uncharacterized phage protein (TIGR01671 family)